MAGARPSVRRSTPLPNLYCTAGLEGHHTYETLTIPELRDSATEGIRKGGGIRVNGIKLLITHQN